MQQLFVQVLQLCQEAGLVKLGHIALDGLSGMTKNRKARQASY